MDNDTIKDSIGIAFGGGAYVIRTALEKAQSGFDWYGYGQEVLEDITGAFISVTIGFFLMRLYRKIFKSKGE